MFKPHTEFNFSPMSIPPLKAEVIGSNKLIKNLNSNNNSSGNNNLNNLPKPKNIAIFLSYLGKLILILKLRLILPLVLKFKIKKLKPITPALKETRGITPCKPNL